ncbi:MAG: alanine--glyoxylate aminotransferase family protein [Candidatus Diapherotrites archaeon]
MADYREYKKLFIPGPTEVRKEILAEMERPMIGHRSKEFSGLYGELIPKLQELLYTKNKVFLSTSSSTGFMEAAVRNCVKKKCLNLVCGAFSEKWHKITVANGKDAEAMEIKWGTGHRSKDIEEKLSTGEFDAMTLVHNETSTGTMNKLYEIAEMMKKFPDVMFLVDTVSSMAGVKIEVDKLGIDVCLAGVQKAFAVPPGLAVAAVSEKAIEKAKQVENRGYYFDFLVFLKSDEKKQTPTTPAISQMYALNLQMDRIKEEGLENRFKRHKEMADYTRKWASDNFELFVEEGYRSDTVTTVTNNKGINVAELNDKLGEREMMLSNGYGDLKEKTFRIGHMGDLTLDEIKKLTDNVDEILGGVK